MYKRTFYSPGDVLCDMHYGFRDLPDDLELVAKVTVRVDGSSELVSRLNCGKNPGNKELVVVGIAGAWTGNITAVWSYDDRHFGMAELKYKE